jgi:transposase-like protein
MPRYTPAQKSEALAYYLTTGSMSAAARQMGCSVSTVKTWVDDAQLNPSAETVDQNEIVDEAERIAQAIRDKQEQVREKLLDRLAFLAKDSTDLKGVATAYGIVTDKALLAQGKPTAITGEAMAFPVDASPDQLVGIADELRRRREQHVAAPTTRSV